MYGLFQMPLSSNIILHQAKLPWLSSKGLLTPIFQEDALQKMSLIGGHSLSGSNFKVHERSRRSTTEIDIYICK